MAKLKCWMEIDLHLCLHLAFESIESNWIVIKIGSVRKNSGAQKTDNSGECGKFAWNRYATVLAELSLSHNTPVKWFFDFKMIVRVWIKHRRQRQRDAVRRERMTGSKLSFLSNRNGGEYTSHAFWPVAWMMRLTLRVFLGISKKLLAKHFDSSRNVLNDPCLLGRIQSMGLQLLNHLTSAPLQLRCWMSRAQNPRFIDECFPVTPIPLPKKLKRIRERER